ncbi:MAG: hypothetical protein FRX49_02578 [Trebouxia sp. A1-2]|nr:MAG: hypothetical protein FRX49_02578 [Trebouxia sp. A1-2]
MKRHANALPHACQATNSLPSIPAAATGRQAMYHGLHGCGCSLLVMVVLAQHLGLLLGTEPLQRQGGWLFGQQAVLLDAKHSVNQGEKGGQVGRELAVPEGHSCFQVPRAALGPAFALQPQVALHPEGMHQQQQSAAYLAHCPHLAGLAWPAAAAAAAAAVVVAAGQTSSWAFSALTAAMSSDGPSMPVATAAARGVGSSEAMAPAVPAVGVAASGESAPRTAAVAHAEELHHKRASSRMGDAMRFHMLTGSQSCAAEWQDRGAGFTNGSPSGTSTGPTAKAAA